MNLQTHLKPNPKFEEKKTKYEETHIWNQNPKIQWRWWAFCYLMLIRGYMSFVMMKDEVGVAWEWDLILVWERKKNNGSFYGVGVSVGDYGERC